MSNVFRCEAGSQLTHFFIILTKQMTPKIYNYNSFRLLQGYYFNKARFFIRFIKISSYFIHLFKIFKPKSINFFHRLNASRLINIRFHTFVSLRGIISSMHLNMADAPSYLCLRPFLLIWIFFIKTHMPAINYN